MTETLRTDGAQAHSPQFEQARFMTRLMTENDYRHVRLLPDGRWVGLRRLLFTTAIITGQIGDETGYDDQWCYHREKDALAALNAWSGEGEPTGWHRHPMSGRRINEDGELVVYT